jgi:hypothetical protein
MPRTTSNLLPIEGIQIDKADLRLIITSVQSDNSSIQGFQEARFSTAAREHSQRIISSTARQIVMAAAFLYRAFFYTALQ